MPGNAREQASPLRQPGDEVVDFNGRDCPEELADLQDAWERLRRTPIQSISLDITPAIEPNETVDLTDESPREMVARAPDCVVA